MVTPISSLIICVHLLLFSVINICIYYVWVNIIKSF
nr:MAG TPA: hypothetical protein [Caudoviricetes sp.]